ncbi:acyl-CoA-binding domain-containing protein 6 isoform X2 [Salvia divinorum]|uniref:Acyl-CoA-binding domain-containing protein 6 isoform X2 n=1 Tax=Salvia divinorum TaxID=28513 RepID=A0ABD1GWF9_SALDI
MKLGRLKVQLSDTAQWMGSPIRPTKRFNSSNGEGVAAMNSEADDLNFHSSSNGTELNNCASGGSENWMVLSISGDKPTPRFNHAAAVIGNTMVVVGGESSNGLLEDVQVLSFDRFSWTPVSSKLYLSPTSLPLKIPACKGHALVPRGKKVLLIGGKTEPVSDRVSASSHIVKLSGHLTWKQNVGHLLKQRETFRLPVVVIQLLGRTLF